MPNLTSFAEVALLLVMAAAIGLVGTLARQPLVVSFIAVWSIAGPSVLEVVHSDAQIDLLSELGIAVLLFLVGIKLELDYNPQAVRRWRHLGLEAGFGDARDPEFVAELPFRGTEWMVSTVPILPTGLSHEDTRRTLIHLARSAGFSERMAVASRSGGGTDVLFGAGVGLVLEPIQDAANCAVELLCGGARGKRTEFPEIAAEGRKAG